MAGTGSARAAHRNEKAPTPKTGHGHFRQLPEPRRHAGHWRRDAKRMPARENAHRNLVLNQRVEAYSPLRLAIRVGRERGTRG